MKTLLYTATLLLSFVAKSQCIADSAANVVAFTYEGKVYEIVKETKNWADAAACALERGGTLAEIDSIKYYCS